MALISRPLGGVFVYPDAGYEREVSIMSAEVKADHHEASGADCDVDVRITKCVPSKKVRISYFDANKVFDVEEKPKEANEVHLASLDE